MYIYRIMVLLAKRMVLLAKSVIQLAKVWFCLQKPWENLFDAWFTCKGLSRNLLMHDSACKRLPGNIFDAWFSLGSRYKAFGDVWSCLRKPFGKLFWCMVLLANAFQKALLMHDSACKSISESFCVAWFCLKSLTKPVGMYDSACGSLSGNSFDAWSCLQKPF